MTTQRQIDASRLLLAPSPVRSLHVPAWLRYACLRVYGRSAWWGTCGPAVVQRAAVACGDSYWLDHFGSTIVGGIQCFVAEPYPQSVDSLRAAERFANSIGADMTVSADSWWYPGATIRLLFSPGLSHDRRRSAKPNQPPRRPAAGI